MTGNNCFKYKVDKLNGLIVVKWLGDVGLECMNESLAGMYSDPAYDPKYKGLCFTTEAVFKLDYEELQRNHQFINSHPRAPRGLWAVICEEPMQTAYAMMYESMEGATHETKVFCTTESALGWLGLDANLDLDFGLAEKR